MKALLPQGQHPCRALLPPSRPSQAQLKPTSTSKASCLTRRQSQSRQSVGEQCTVSRRPMLPAFVRPVRTYRQTPTRRRTCGPRWPLAPIRPALIVQFPVFRPAQPTSGWRAPASRSIRSLASRTISSRRRMRPRPCLLFLVFRRTTISRSADLQRQSPKDSRRRTGHRYGF